MSNNRTEQLDMKVALDAAYAKIESLIEEKREMQKRISEFEIREKERENSNTEIAIAYQKACNKIDALEKEVSDLKTVLQLTIDKDKLKERNIFGRSSEKMNDLLNNSTASEIIDEDANETPSCDEARAKRNRKNIKRIQNSDTTKPRKPKKSLDLSNLPEAIQFLLNVDELNAKYGEGNWRIVHWSESKSVEYPRNTAYVLRTMRPVISVGLEHEMVRIPNKNEFYPGSYVSPSLMAEIVYQKYFLFLPLYRIESEFRNKGLNLSRQTMSNWIMESVNTYLWMVYDYLITLLMNEQYHQCDETTWSVIMDGRPAGSKSFIWLHTTSELCECNPIIIFAYEMTRGTDHLRKFYEDFAGVIVCDAYCSYHVLQKEKEEIIIICGCMMHLRRRFAESLALMDTKNISDEQLDELVEVKALKLIGEIYDADEALKNLSPEERTVRRNTEVRPRVKAFYDYIESLDANDPSLSARCRDAISYPLNQKEYIVRFLEDGHIPLDNGFAERCIKPVALLRNASLFSFSIQGAESSMIVHSLMETAKANGADGYWYIRYLFEFLPSKLDEKDRSFLSSTTPWSEEYKAYEAANRHKVESYRDYDDLAEKPKTPRKKDRVNIA